MHLLHAQKENTPYPKPFQRQQMSELERQLTNDLLTIENDMTTANDTDTPSNTNSLFNPDQPSGTNKNQERHKHKTPGTTVPLSPQSLSAFQNHVHLLYNDMTLGYDLVFF